MLRFLTSWVMVVAALLLSIAQGQSGAELEHNSTIIDNNSLLSVEEVGEDSNNVLRCLTTNRDCCRPSDTMTGVGQGNWYLPNGELVSELQSVSMGAAFYIQRENGSVDLYQRNNSISVEGIYHCEIPLGTGVNGSAYVGLYSEGNGLPVVTSLMFDQNAAMVTCLSTGGPVTDVTWFVNNVMIPLGSVYFETRTIVSTMDATYRAVLSANDANSFLGEVECIVSNNGGESRRNITVDTTFPHNPTILNAVVTATALTLTWQGPTRELIDFYQVNVTYTAPCTEDAPPRKSITAYGGSSTMRTVSGLVPGSAYYVTIVAVNGRGRSDVISATYMTEQAAPSGSLQNFRVVQIAMTTIALSWEPLPCISRNSNITSYRLSSSSLYGSSMEDVQSGTGTQDYTLQNLIPGTSYVITLGAVNSEAMMGPTVTTTNTTVLASEPVLFLKGRIIPNNTILDINEVGEGDQALFCLTNLTACCRRPDTINMTGAIGNWLYSNGENIPNLNTVQQGTDLGLFYDNRGMSAVRLNRLGTGVRPLEVGEGLLQCFIPDDSGELQDLFVGVYADSGGGVSTELLYDTATTSLICRSTGGPASSVEWAEGGVEVDTSDEQYEAVQVVVNASLSWYDNILTLRRASERENLGNYACSVSNSRSNSSARVEVREPLVPAVIRAKVGSRSTFNCSTPDEGTVDTILWLNSTGGVVAVATNSATAVLVLDPPSLSDDNVQYSCRMTNGITATTTIQLEPSLAPRNLRANTTSSNSSTFMWVEPEDAVPSYLAYNLSCSPSLMGVASRSVSTSPGATWAELGGLEEGTTYACSVRAEVAGFMSEVASVEITTDTTPPEASPASFSISQVTARSATFSWEPLPVLDRNGIITSYTLSCNASSSQGGVVVASRTEAGSFTVEGFAPDETYTCALWASNSAGRGPEVVMTTTFMDDDSFFQLRLFVPDCGTWVISNTAGKRRDIEAEVLKQLSNWCRCGLSPALIQDGRFTECFDTSSVTYRASIQGIADITSQGFVEQIQQWVWQSMPFIVSSVEMRVDTACPVMISSLDAPGCPSSSLTALLPIIVGAAGGGVVFLTLCCIGVIIFIFLRKRKTRRKTISGSRKHNLDLAPYRITLQNTNAGDNSSDDENYAHIPPQLPARPASVSDMRSHSTNLKNMQNRSASQHSIRYIRGPNGSTNVTDGGDSYAEIDLANSSRLRQRRPSDYEPVLVRNIGLMSTEALNSLSPTSLPRDEQDATGKKLGDFEMPNLHPALGNDYEAMRNIGYLSSSIPVLDTSHVAETSMSEDETEVIRNTRALSMSTTEVPNPMYSTSTSTLGVLTSPKRISESNLDSWVSPRRGEDGYSIPNKVKRPSWSTDIAQPNAITVGVGSMDNLPARTDPSSQHNHPSNVLYNVPRIPAEMGGSGSLIALDDPNQSGRVMVGSKHPFSPSKDVLSGQPSDRVSNYCHPNHVLYNIPTMPEQTRCSVSPGQCGSNGFQNQSNSNGLNGSTHASVPQTYDIPPSRHEGVNSSNRKGVNSDTSKFSNEFLQTDRTRIGNETYDIPKSSTKGGTLYDIPTSSEKLEHNFISGTGSSEIKT